MVISQLFHEHGYHRSNQEVPAALTLPLFRCALPFRLVTARPSKFLRLQLVLTHGRFDSDMLFPYAEGVLSSLVAFVLFLLPIRIITHRAMTLNVRIVTVTKEQKAGCWHSVDTICNILFFPFNIFMLPGDTCPQNYVTEPRIFLKMCLTQDLQPPSAKAISNTTSYKLNFFSEPGPLS